MEDSLVRIFQSSEMVRFFLELCFSLGTGSLCVGGLFYFYLFCVKWAHNKKQLKASGAVTGTGVAFW